MPWRWYPKTNKVARADGTVARYKSRCKKWIKSNRPYKTQKRGLEKKSIWSRRFGLLELYNRKEQQQLICPSGYSISQCFNVMGKMWFAYRKAKDHDKDVEKMEKYARAIQSVQKDMGIKTTSFPHLGIYGDVFILNDKSGKRVVFEDHSAMKKKQEEYEKWQAENSKEIQQHVQKPDKEAGEEIEVFADDKSLSDKQEPEEDEIVPDMLEPDEEAGEEEVIMTDDIPFK
jgi:pyruvate/oxaloacetate carboxyltransferase